MTKYGFTQLAVAFALLPMSVAAQTTGPRVAIKAAAVRAVMGTHRVPPILLLNDDVSDTTATHHVAAIVRANVRGTADSRACKGDLMPQCPWTAGGDTVVMRARVASIKDDRAVAIVDSWGPIPGAKPGWPKGYFVRSKVELVRLGQTWVVVSQTTLFET